MADEATEKTMPVGLVKKPEMARLASVSTRLLESWMARGCPHVRFSYRCVRFDPVQVLGWVERKFGYSRRHSLGAFGRGEPKSVANARR